jgi:hypothetical protein
MLVTLYPSSSTIVKPETFANQLVSSSHQLLGRNLAMSFKTRIISVYIGDITLPSLPAIISEPVKLSRREQAKLDMKNSAITASKKASLIKDHLLGGFSSLWYTIVGRLGIGSAGREYVHFEDKVLRVLRRSRFGNDRYMIGQYSYLSLLVSRVPLSISSYILQILPTLPSAAGPLHPMEARPSRVTTSASSSDHDDLASSIHTPSHSSKADDYESSASGAGLDGSWVGLDAQ